MNLRIIGPFAAAFALLAPSASHANLAAYAQNFESLALADGAALGNDGWKVYGNVYNADPSSWLYGYGPYAAPNGGEGFSRVVTGFGQAAQGTQQLVVYSDYANGGAQRGGQLVEALVFQEQTVGAADAGNTWTFSFDARLSDLASPSTAQAFVKTLDPKSGYATTSYAILDMTQISSSWRTYSIELPISVGEGQLLQFGFSATATKYNPSGVLYDNISMTAVPEPATYALMLGGLGLLVAFSRRRAK